VDEAWAGARRVPHHKLDEKSQLAFVPCSHPQASPAWIGTNAAAASARHVPAAYPPEEEEVEEGQPELAHAARAPQHAKSGAARTRRTWTLGGRPRWRRRPHRDDADANEDATEDGKEEAAEECDTKGYAGAAGGEGSDEEGEALVLPAAAAGDGPVGGSEWAWWRGEISYDDEEEKGTSEEEVPSGETDSESERGARRGGRARSEGRQRTRRRHSCLHAAAPRRARTPVKKKISAAVSLDLPAPGRSITAQCERILRTPRRGS